jgi:hypothetical protein
MTLDKLTAADFEPHIGSTFTIHYTDAEALDVSLASVAPMPYDPPPGQRRGFSLTFQSILADRYLPQRVYTITHPALGTLELFIVPHQANQTGFTYEVIFN